MTEVKDMAQPSYCNRSVDPQHSKHVLWRTVVLSRTILDNHAPYNPGSSLPPPLSQPRQDLRIAAPRVLKMKPQSTTSPRRAHLSPPASSHTLPSPRAGVRSPPRSPYERLPATLPTPPMDRRTMDAKDLSEYIRAFAPQPTSPLMADLVLDKQITAQTLISLTEDELESVADRQVAEDLHDLSLQIRGHQTHKRLRSLKDIVSDLAHTEPSSSPIPAHDNSDFDWTASPIIPPAPLPSDSPAVTYSDVPDNSGSGLALTTNPTLLRRMSTLLPLSNLSLTVSPAPTRAPTMEVIEGPSIDTILLDTPAAPTQVQNLISETQVVEPPTPASTVLESMSLLQSPVHPSNVELQRDDTETTEHNDAQQPEHVTFMEVVEPESSHPEVVQDNTDAAEVVPANHQTADPHDRGRTEDAAKNSPNDDSMEHPPTEDITEHSMDHQSAADTPGELADAGVDATEHQPAQEKPSTTESEDVQHSGETTQEIGADGKEHNGDQIGGETVSVGVGKGDSPTGPKDGEVEDVEVEVEGADGGMDGEGGRETSDQDGQVVPRDGPDEPQISFPPAVVPTPDAEPDAPAKVSETTTSVAQTEIAAEDPLVQITHDGAPAVNPEEFQGGHDSQQEDAPVTVEPYHHSQTDHTQDPEDLSLSDGEVSSGFSEGLTSSEEDIDVEEEDDATDSKIGAGQPTQDISHTEKEDLLIDFEVSLAVEEQAGEGLREFCRALDGIFSSSSRGTETDAGVGLATPSSFNLNLPEVDAVSSAFPPGNAEDTVISASLHEDSSIQESDEHPRDVTVADADASAPPSAVDSIQIQWTFVDMPPLSEDPLISPHLQSNNPLPHDTADTTSPSPQAPSGRRHQRTPSLRLDTERTLWSPLESRRNLFGIRIAPRMRRYSSAGDGDGKPQLAVPPTFDLQPPPSLAGPSPHRGRLDSPYATCFAPLFRSSTPPRSSRRWNRFFR
ncbi:hypothetical protein BXZ70DRAFT_906983 [Cristinia sonorae]|uniref:Uncharacterized protein n=1 Tax=Cristinia sonorae TaxID=1940300 RepID=A0A8K0UNR9_9AGAR|nr:hypothetical protein BXZ70DRAFT_906983 [Cristinia sonorae]